MSLDEGTIRDVLTVNAHGKSISRSDVGGVMMVYDLDDVPPWLQPILDARDEDGDPSDAIKSVTWPDGMTAMLCTPGTAITGAS